MQAKLSKLQKAIIAHAAKAKTLLRPDYRREGMDISYTELKGVIYGKGADRSADTAIARAVARLEARGLVRVRRYQFGKHRSGIILTND